MRLVLLGAPGSGKGTQGKLLSEKHHIPQISTGDLLRAAVAAGTWLGKQAKAAMDAGQLVSDDVVLGIIGERLLEPDAARGFILDGFPRNIPQAQALDRMLGQMSTPVEVALLIDVDFEVLIERLTGRRTCETCGQTYNVYTSPSRLDDQCDRCGGNLRHRSDDNEETITNRLRVYESQTSPLVAYYRNQGKLRVVAGHGEIPEIFKMIEKAVHEKPAANPPPAAVPAGKPAGKAVQPPAKARAAQAVKAAPEKKAAVEKASAKTTAKATAKKPVEKKAGVKKAAKKTLKKAAAKKAVAAKKKPVKKKIAAKKKAVKKAPVKKVKAKKKTTAKKVARKGKVLAKKPGAKKKTAVKKAAKKKAVNKKIVKKKAVKRR